MYDLNLRLLGATGHWSMLKSTSAKGEGWNNTVKSNKQSVNDSNNYRAIALSSVIGKILDHIILMKNVNTLCSNDLQFGFKSGHSTSQCTFVLQEIIDLYLRNDSAVYLILLDASKAFDRVKYCKLFDILLNRNMCSSYLRLITSPPIGGGRGIVMPMSVCLFVCVFVCLCVCVCLFVRVFAKIQSVISQPFLNRSL